MTGPSSNKSEYPAIPVGAGCFLSSQVLQFEMFIGLFKPFDIAISSFALGGGNGSFRWKIYRAADWY